MAYQCDEKGLSQVVIDNHQYYLCKDWDYHNTSVLDELNSLSKQDASTLIITVVMYWLICWAFRELLIFIRND